MGGPAGEEKNKNREEKPPFGWKDILAFCLAMYQILLPQLFIIFIVVLVVLFLVFWLWLG